MRFAACLLLLVASPALASPPPGACALRSGVRHLRDVLRAGNYDKFRHCSLSCILTLECGAKEAWRAGVLKEIGDLLIWHGDPDVEDLKADRVGIDIGLKLGREGPPEACFSECERQYRRKK